MLSRLRALIKQAAPRRAIDFHEGDKINEAAFKALIREAVTLEHGKPAIESGRT